MKGSAVIELVSTEYEADGYGNQIPVDKKRTVYANSGTIGSREFFEAGRNDLKPEKSFEVYSFEYQEESKLLYEGQYYRIYRTSGPGDKVILFCEKVTADG